MRRNATGVLFLLGALLPNTSPAQSQALPAPSLVPANGSHVAYTRGVDEDGDGIFLGGSAEESRTDVFIRALTPGSIPVRVNAANNQADVTPSFSPDGTRLAWASRGTTTGTFDILLKDLPTGVIVNLTATGALVNERWPTWSADGATIFYNRGGGGQNLDVWAMNADGSDQRPVAGVPGATKWTEDCCASPTPDGTSVVFASNRAGNFDIYRYPLGPGHPEVPGALVRLTTRRSYEGTPAVEATGTVLYRDGATQKIFRLDPSGPADNGVLVPTSGFVRTPSGSPDGTQIVFGTYADKGRQLDIAIANADGTGEILLTRTPRLTETDPDWQPLPPQRDARG